MKTVLRIMRNSRQTFNQPWTLKLIINYIITISENLNLGERWRNKSSVSNFRRTTNDLIRIIYNHNSLKEYTFCPTNFCAVATIKKGFNIEWTKIIWPLWTFGRGADLHFNCISVMVQYWYRWICNIFRRNPTAFALALFPIIGFIINVCFQF